MIFFRQVLRPKQNFLLCLFFLCPEMHFPGVFDQLFCIFLLRGIEDLLRRAGLRDLSFLHHIYAAAQRGNHPQIMADQKKRCFRIPDHFPQQPQNLRLHCPVQGGGGLICNDQPGITGKGNGDYHSLPHAAGQLKRILLHPKRRITDSHQIQKFQRTLLCFFLRAFSPVFHCLSDLFSDFHRRIETVLGILKNHGNIVPWNGNLPVQRQIFIFHFCIFCGNSHNRPHCRTFPAAGPAHQSGDLPLFYRKRKTADGVRISFFRMILYVQILYIQHVHLLSLPSVIIPAVRLFSAGILSQWYSVRFSPALPVWSSSTDPTAFRHRSMTQSTTRGQAICQG